MAVIEGELALARFAGPGKGQSGPGNEQPMQVSDVAHCWHLEEKGDVEAPGIDPGTSRMLSERSTI